MRGHAALGAGGHAYRGSQYGTSSVISHDLSVACTEEDEKIDHRQPEYVHTDVLNAVIGFYIPSGARGASSPL
ncbi:hypothetical protein [Nonomuraea angiospora]|uniref:hypothetical protein n=1 Tax=Nonomuraea angiospora TaxID=46172 RepID=UPI0029C9F8B6|nr:hypothetical protein [Nonomuraea angiospora]